MSDLGIVHGDIKPDNILVDFDGSRFRSIKIIDFGTAFIHDDSPNFSMSTPEYLSPEVLKHLLSKRNMGKFKNHLKSQIVSDCDIWSLGVIFFEILLGFPVWLGMKGKAEINGLAVLGFGYFGTGGRDYEKIVQKQKGL